MSVHANSIEAIESLKASGAISKRCKEILSALDGSYMEYVGRSDRAIAEMLGYADMNSVRPRITEMIKAGILEETESRVDPKTGKRCRRVRIKRR